MACTAWAFTTFQLPTISSVHDQVAEDGCALLAWKFCVHTASLRTNHRARTSTVILEQQILSDCVRERPTESRSAPSVPKAVLRPHGRIKLILANTRALDLSKSSQVLRADKVFPLQQHGSSAIITSDEHCSEHHAVSCREQ